MGCKDHDISSTMVTPGICLVLFLRLTSASGFCAWLLEGSRRRAPPLPLSLFDLAVIFRIIPAFFTGHEWIS
jgi:hypothetical protein